MGVFQIRLIKYVLSFRETCPIMRGKTMNRLIAFLLCFMLLLSVHENVNANTSAVDDINAKSGILVEHSTGKILYEKNIDVKMYPASMTKLLTVLVSLDYLELTEIITVGNEIYSVPADSSKAGNVVGESLTVENLMRLIIIPSGNETSCVAARAVAKKVTGNEEISYPEAEKVFVDLMNEKAKSMGAMSSHFANPHGYHDDSHYSTARDMSIISRAALDDPFISQIIMEKSFIGSGLGDNSDSTIHAQDYRWYTHNSLLKEDSDFFYSHATGMKTGFTNEAGYCLSASAEKDNISLISVVFFSGEEERYNDVINLFEYGFSNYSFETVQNAEQIMDSVPLSNHKLGDEEFIDIYSQNIFTDFITRTELASIKKKIIYDEKYITSEEEKDEKQEETNDMLQFKAPIIEGEVIGRIVYTLNNEEIFTDSLVAGRTVEERTLKTDIEYYKEYIKANAFTVKAIPVWAVGFAILFILVQIIIMIVRRKKNKKKRYGYYKKY